MAFVQLIEFVTTRVDDVRALVDEWRSQVGDRTTVRRAMVTEDRDRPGTYVEFPSYEEAMRNSALPETTALAEKLANLCVGPPLFRNLDVRQVEEL